MKSTNEKGSTTFTVTLSGRPVEIRRDSDGVFHVPNEMKGLGTALKPAFEPIVVAQKPREGTYAENALTWGCGALNIDGCRIGYESAADKAGATPQGRVTSKESAAIGAEPDAGRGLERVEFDRPEQKGRWPANVLLDQEAARALDAQTADLQPSKGAYQRKHGERQFLGQMGDERVDRPNGISDSGGASRFFYTSKASKKDRTMDGRVDNKHVTVKPTDLMGYLVRLVCPPGGTVLDPFCGSGSTGVACVREGLGFVGVELESESAETARQRIAVAEADLAEADPDDAPAAEPAQIDLFA